MAEVNGFIKYYRKILDNPIICKDSEHFAIWSYLLLNATHTEQEKMFNGQKITLKKGQLITSRKSISEQFNISESKCERVFKLFKNEQMIEQQTCSKNRLITIVKWNDYQSSGQQNEQQVDNKWTTTEQQVDTNNKDKKEKKDKNDNKKSYGTFKNVKLTEVDSGVESRVEYFHTDIRDKILDIRDKENKSNTNALGNTQDNELTELFEIFESEFKRPLSSNESEKIIYWYNQVGSKYIIHGLREILIYKKMNINYLEKVLLGWTNNKITLEMLNEGKKTKGELNETIRIYR